MIIFDIVIMNLKTLNRTKKDEVKKIENAERKMQGNLKQFKWLVKFNIKLLTELIKYFNFQIKNPKKLKRLAKKKMKKIRKA